MGESLTDQIELGLTGCFYPEKELSLKKVGRKRVINQEKYLEAIKKVLSTSDIAVAKELNVNRTTVYRFRKKYPHIRDEAKRYLGNIEDISFTRKIEMWKNFFNLSIIQDWYEILKNIRRIKENKIMAYLRTFWYICKYLKIHPRKIKLDECVKLNLQLKNLYYEGEKQPLGLSYLSVRESLRSFFILIKNISGEHLTNRGITKETIPTYGRYAKQKVSSEIRRKFEKALKNYSESDIDYLELLNISKLMYYTGTRISATLKFNFKINNFNLDNKIWMLEVIDKGRNGGKKWEKYIIGHALKQFKEYCSKRFDISIEDLEKELPNKTDHLFPKYIDENGKTLNSKVYNIFKKALRDSGIPYKKFPPTHIWRHTFAQEFLKATDWNYDLCALLGGWTSTDVLKKAYGEMGLDSKINGLRKAMGLPVQIEIHEVKW